MHFSADCPLIIHLLNVKTSHGVFDEINEIQILGWWCRDQLFFDGANVVYLTNACIGGNLFDLCRDSDISMNAAGVKYVFRLKVH